MQMDEFVDQARAIVTDDRLTFHQRRHYLAALAESALPYPAISQAATEALNKGIVSDLFEGHAPYRPRYILPDYDRAIRQGSEHLELEPPTTLDEALTFLLILYTQVPSITGYPVFLGDIDSLLLPFVDDVSDEDLREKLRLFWMSLDRILPDGFVHANIGPNDNRVLRAVLDVDRELLQIVPNLSLKVDPEATSDDVLLDAIETVFATAKPHFVNHTMMVGDLGTEYGIVSCYNSLKKGGGSHTLVRLNLKEVALAHTGTIDEFIDETLPHFAELNAEIMAARITYLVEEAGFFEHDFLAREGLVRLDRFSAMFGVYGLAEAVNLLMEHAGSDDRYFCVPYQQAGGLDIGTGEHPVAGNVGINDGSQRPAVYLFGHLGNGHFSGFCPAARGDSPVPRIKTQDNTVGEFSAPHHRFKPGHVFHCAGSYDDLMDADVEQFGDDRFVANAAAHFQFQIR